LESEKDGRKKSNLKFRALKAREVNGSVSAEKCERERLSCSKGKIWRW
jgi:hypothetical protein